MSIKGKEVWIGNSNRRLSRMLGEGRDSRLPAPGAHSPWNQNVWSVLGLSSERIRFNSLLQHSPIGRGFEEKRQNWKTRKKGLLVSSSKTRERMRSAIMSIADPMKTPS